jgi:hypothetical protein
MTNGIIDKEPSFKMGQKNAGEALGGDIAQLKKRYHRAAELNTAQQVSAVKLRKLIEEKNKELEEMTFFRQVCWKLWQEGLMTEQCELVARSATKMTDGQFENLRKSAKAGKDPNHYHMEQSCDTITMLEGLNASDLSMKSTMTKLNASQEKTAPSNTVEPPEEEEQIHS